MNKPINMDELEAQLKKAQDRVFIMEYYKYQNQNADLKQRNEFLEQENKKLKAAFESNVKFNPTQTLNDAERYLISKALQHYDGNKMLAAESLGITVKTLYNKLYEFNLLEGNQK
jgi:DNA-binding NtrC family response regulator